jgi:hypothetical protein
MDEMNLVRAMLDDQPAPTAAEVATARRRVLGGRRMLGADRVISADRVIGADPEIAAGPAGPGRRPARRPSYRRRAAFGAIGAAAAAVAVAVATVPGGATAPVGAPADGSAGGGHTDQPAELSASQILLVAADKAALAPATGGRWQLHTVTGGQVLTTGGYLVDHRYDTELWVPTAAAEPTWRIMHDLGTGPATPADVAAWKRAGAPTRWTIPLRKLTPAEQRQQAEKIKINRKANPNGPLTRAPKAETMTAAGGAPFAAREDNHGTVGVIANKPHTLAEVAALPTDPAALQAWLEREILAGQRRDGRGMDRPMSAELFDQGMQIASHLPVSPALRSATFRMLAGLPGVRAVGQVRDPLGRTGYAVALPEKSGGAGTEQRLILDLRTGATLAWEVVVTTAYPADPHSARVGQVLTYEVTVGSGWTNARPKLPARKIGPEDAVG